MKTTRKSPQEIAVRLAKDLDKGEWPEDLEPQEVAWLLSELTKSITNKFIEVGYMALETRGGKPVASSGLTRMYLGDLIYWLRDHPGTLIISITEV